MKGATMFNAANGHAQSDKIIDELSDLFAADFEDVLNDPSMTRDQKEQLIQQLSDVVANRDTAKAFAAGTYAQNSSGQPAAAIGAGPSTTPTNEQQAMSFLLGSGSIPQGIKQALRRLMTPQDPAHIAVGFDGTPIDVGQLRQQVASLTTERDDARQQLANAQSTSGLDTLKAEVKSKLDPAQHALGQSIGVRGGSKLSSNDYQAVRDGVNEALRLVQ